MSTNNTTNVLAINADSTFNSTTVSEKRSDLELPADDTFSERLAILGFGCLMAYFILRSIVQAISRPFWYDEILTWGVARQPSIASIWKTLARASDGQPPTYYIVERVFGHLVQNDHIALRLPSIVAFCVLMVCAFIWVRKYSGSVVALVCSAIVVISPLYDPYAVEARPYALVAACIAFGLLCYDRADSRRWVVLLGLSLMFAQSFHYYAIFPIASFGIAELIFAVRAKKIRWDVWLAVSLSIVPLALTWPLLRNFKQYYGQNYWAKPNSWSLFTSYYVLVRPLIPGSFSYTARIIVTAIVSLGLLGAAVLLGLRSIRNQRDALPSFQVLCAVGALLALPMTLFLATTLVHGGFTERYTLPIVIGIVFAVGYFLRGRRTIAVVGLAAFVFICSVREEAFFWHRQKNTFLQVRSDADAIKQIVYASGYPDLPVVVSDSMEIVPLAYYAQEEWQKRFIVLLDPPEALRYVGTDSNEKELAVLNDILPIHTAKFDEFRATHSQFLLYSSSGGQFSSDWWPSRLTTEGYSVKTIQTRGIRNVYLVDLQKRSNLRD